MSTYLVICDDKKPNLFLKELILSWAIIGRFLFFPLKFSRKPAVRDVLLLLLNEADSGLKGCSDSARLLFEISEHPLVFQKIFSITFIKFLLKRFEPNWFKCKPLPASCLTFILLLFVESISNALQWRSVLYSFDENRSGSCMSNEYKSLSESNKMASLENAI